MPDCRPPRFAGRRERERIGRHPPALLIAGYFDSLRPGGAYKITKGVTAIVAVTPFNI